METIKLVEAINTWQGEGPDAGRCMTLVRFKTCNRIEGLDGLKSCHYCDTAIKLKISADADYHIDDIQEMVNHTGGLLITGGEPTSDKNILSTLKLLTNIKFGICNIETNGNNVIGLLSAINYSKYLEEYKKSIKIIFSPKFFNDKELDMNFEILAKIISNPSVYIKVVDTNDFLFDEFMCRLHKSFDFPCNKLWIMPQGKTREELILNSSHTIDVCDEYKANFSSRNHIIYQFI